MDIKISFEGSVERISDLKEMTNVIDEARKIYSDVLEKLDNYASANLFCGYIWGVYFEKNLKFVPEIYSTGSNSVEIYL